MPAKRKGLGRGLNALLGESGNVATDTTSATTPAEWVANAAKDGELLQMPVEWLQRGRYQPRKDMSPEALDELAASIRAQGVMQPIVVRSIGEQRYEIIAGERRWRASQLAGKERVPAVVRQISDSAAMAMALIENIQREDLNPLEEAEALKRLQDEFKLTQQQVAESVGKSRTTVTNLLRLMGLAEPVKKLLAHGDLEMGHARAMLPLSQDQQQEAARDVTARGLSVRQTEALVRRLQSESTEKDNDKSEPDADTLRLQERLSEKFGVPVALQLSAKGRGKLVFNYTSLEELDGILSHLGYQE